jgi:hypothetical protein
MKTSHTLQVPVALEPYAVSVRGQPVLVPSLRVGEARIITTGRLVRVASIHDEEWIEQGLLPDPARAVEVLATGAVKADVFCFSERPATAGGPAAPYPSTFDNAAVVALTTYDQWWAGLPQATRRNVRTAAKKGVITRRVEYTDELVHGIKSLYDEAPIRLGKPFWHHGKSFETVKRENGTYLERSRFIGAFLEDRLIGFIKYVRVDQVASIMQILSRIDQQDKRTTNALIARAVESAIEDGMRHLQYCKYVYNDDDTSSLTDFKRRNGFVRLDLRRYHVPLTVRGRVAVMLGLADGLRGAVPPRVLKMAVRLRARYHARRERGGGDVAD